MYSLALIIQPKLHTVILIWKVFHLYKVWVVLQTQYFPNLINVSLGCWFTTRQSEVIPIISCRQLHSILLPPNSVPYSTQYFSVIGAFTKASTIPTAHGPPTLWTFRETESVHAKVKNRTRKYIILIPTTVEEAYKYDKQNQNTYWKDAILKVHIMLVWYQGKLEVLHSLINFSLDLNDFFHHFSFSPKKLSLRRGKYFSNVLFKIGELIFENTNFIYIKNKNQIECCTIIMSLQIEMIAEPLPSISIHIVSFFWGIWTCFWYLIYKNSHF